MNLLSAPQAKPINKDAVIEDLKRKLQATEYLLEIQKEETARYHKMAFEYWQQLNPELE
jgi:hypothetical protein